MSCPFYMNRSFLVLNLPLLPFKAAGMDALYIANKAINTLDLSDPSSWPLAKSVTHSYLGQADEAAEGGLQLGGRHKVYAIGHCHIDTAWLWPFSETRRKTARSWSSQLKIMETHPEHAFAASSAQQVTSQ
jgi:alpha-mannosidase